jgi:hypothetical protein
MKRAWWLVLLSVGALVCAADSRAGEGKGTEVDFDGLRSRAPAAWKAEAVKKGGLRYAQFRLPKKGDDKADAEVVIFKGIGGGSKANIDRWKGMFIPPKGKTLDEVSSVKELKVGKVKVHYLNISGTYKYNPQPFNPNSKVELRPGYRMIGVVFEGPEDVYHIRLVGPEGTVTHYQQGFDEWLKAFK